MADPLEFFHREPYRYNCAQSVAAAAEAGTETVAKLAAAGGGRAKGGCCGALFAALLLTPSEAHDALKREFQARAGALTCREIKQIHHFPCTECVKLGDVLRRKYARS